MKKIRLVSIASLLLVLFAFTACNSTKNNAELEEEQAQEDILAQEDEEVLLDEEELTEEEIAIQEHITKQDEEITALNAELEKQKKIAESRYSYKEVVLSEDKPFPPEAKPGQCFARIFVPQKTQTVTEKILVKEASERLEVFPTVYDVVTEEILVCPAYTTWKKGTGSIQKIDNQTGEIMCLVEVPAVYKTIYKEVVVSPPTTKSFEIPAEYQTVSREEVVKEASMEWVPVLCDVNMTPAKITEIQTALEELGYPTGDFYGSLGSGTLEAIKLFQADNDLLVTDYITIETLEQLDVTYF
ncbi:MAG TPA: peptidoglycan-binding domain-containing protein [Treponemataceae bacterium]|nr:peptidoglycan-binding domain-containing protein [Treponemataceae bacterium]